jgi:hypothetical protein
VNLTAYPASSGWSLVAYLRGESVIDISVTGRWQPTRF